GKRVNKRVEFSVWQRAIDVAVSLRQVASDVVCSQQNFQGTPPSDQAGQPGHRTAAGHQSRAHFPLRQDRLLSTGETHVAGERKLAADARRPPANARDRNDRSATQPHKHVRKLLQARGTWGKSRSFLRLREEVVVRQEESIDGAVKDDNLDLLVGL